MHISAQPRRGRSWSRGRGFTLLELMVVLSVLALLTGILLPYMTRTFELVYATTCRRNLRGLAEAMHGGQVENPLSMPSPATWPNFALKYGSRELMLCRQDFEVPTAKSTELADLYILQYNHANQWEIASVKVLVDWMNGGGGSVDSAAQIWVMSSRPSSGGVHSFNKLGPDVAEPRPNLSARWLPNPATLRSNEYVILVYDDCGIRIVIDEVITIYSIDGEKDGVKKPGSSSTYCNSSHYLVQGKIGTVDDSKSDPEKGLPGVKLLMHLTGKNYVNIVDPPVTLGGGRCSYVMNGRITPKEFGPQQLLLMDGNQVYIDIDEFGNFEPGWEQHVQPRHIISGGPKVNAAYVDGHVGSLSVDDLLAEQLLFEEQGRASRSLWNHRASPRK